MQEIQSVFLFRQYYLSACASNEKDAPENTSRHISVNLLTQPGSSMREARGTLSLAAQSLCFTLTPGLRALIMATATGLTENTCLLHFAIKLLQCNLK